MRTVNLHQARAHLSRLVEQAVAGEPFIIAKAGKPVVKVSSLEASPHTKMRRLGFMIGYLQVPTDFDRIGISEIEQLFSGEVLT